jgi:hemin uptake protein HemP
MLPTEPAESASDVEPKTAGQEQARTRRDPGLRPRRVSSSELLGAAAELVIMHGQREYRLRVTSNGKLILTA